jgi:hypothetical protein
MELSPRIKADARKLHAFVGAQQLKLWYDTSDHASTQLKLFLKRHVYYLFVVPLFNLRYQKLNGNVPNVSHLR